MSGPLAYTLLPEGQTPRLGLIVLQVDETIEDDFRRLFAPQAISLQVSRIPSGAELTPQSIARMDAALNASAALLPDTTFDAVGYACTSGTTLIGATRVAEQVRAGCTARAVTNPLTATRAALAALNARRVAIVSPYIPSVAQPLCTAFEADGITVTEAVSFGERIERNVARITPESLCDAARHAVATGTPEALFLSCTNLKTLDVIAPLEAELGLPVLSSNLTLAWHMAATARAKLAPDLHYRLCQTRHG
ncbi:maleate cis-trans isomerase family protein [Primorskyibacter sp. S187A]|uniref:maleate cis-trans isomerase family protein n=1 Tax=Primorskyibacter sp. S187A TaxID=3415130 RepID=UPI003C7E1E78